MSKRKWSDQDLINAVKESFSYSQVIQKLGLRPAGSNYDTVKFKIKSLDLDISHFTGQGWNTGVRYQQIRPAKPLNEVLTNPSFHNSNNLRKRLLNEGIKERKCERCSNSYWQGYPISLELHHVNGDKFDNRLENLQILCPNCHALTHNYCGKNIKVMSAQRETSDVEAG